MTFEKIIQDLKNKIYHPVYFLYGNEPYYIDILTDYISEHVLDPVEKEFNQTVLYGKEVDISEVLSTAKRYPMMSNYQVVIVKEAQEIKNFEKNEGFVHYLDNPLSSTVLVFAYKYKTPDSRTKLGKKLKEKSVFFESKKMYDDKLPGFISSYLQSKNYCISPRASALIAENIGNDLSRIANELDKLCVNVAEGKEISIDEIERNIGISKEYNIFEFQNALSKKDVLKANRIINYFAANPKNNPLILIVGNLYNYFSKILIYHQLSDKSRNNAAATLGINAYFLKDYEQAARTFPMGKAIKVIEYLRECDMKSKGVGSDNAEDGELMKELVFKILH